MLNDNVTLTEAQSAIDAASEHERPNAEAAYVTLANVQSFASSFLSLLESGDEAALRSFCHTPGTWDLALRESAPRLTLQLKGFALGVPNIGTEYLDDCDVAFVESAMQALGSKSELVFASSNSSNVVFSVEPAGRYRVLMVWTRSQDARTCEYSLGNIYLAMEAAMELEGATHNLPLGLDWNSILRPFELRSWNDHVSCGEFVQSLRGRLQSGSSRLLRLDNPFGKENDDCAGDPLSEENLSVHDTRWLETAFVTWNGPSLEFMKDGKRPILLEWRRHNGSEEQRVHTLCDDGSVMAIYPDYLTAWGFVGDADIISELTVRDDSDR